MRPAPLAGVFSQGAGNMAKPEQCSPCKMLNFCLGVGKTSPAGLHDFRVIAKTF